MPRTLTTALARQWLAALVVVAVIGGTRDGQALSRSETRHLLGRVAFGPVPGDYARFAPLTREQAVDRLIRDAESPPDPVQVPAWAEKPWSPRWWKHRARFADPSEERRLQQVESRAWWFRQMLTSRNRVRERMALYWHEFYPTIKQKLPAQSIWQIQKFRSNALGNYAHLLTLFTQDGCTIENLNLFDNRRGHINENFARELFELYTLGRGNYSENDIRETARAFTGWRVQRSSDVFFVWYPGHDFGVKTVLGSTGRLGGSDVLRLVTAHPRFAEYQVERMWKTFVGPIPERAAVQRLAASFRQDYDVKRLLRALLLEDAFWDPSNRASLVKSPVELVVGALRAAGLGGSYATVADLWSRAMGQKVFFAPDVKGWRGHNEWITAGSLEYRLAFVRGLAHGFDRSVGEMFERIGQLPPAMSARDVGKIHARLWHELEVRRAKERGLPGGDELLDPAFQLK